MIRVFASLVLVLVCTTCVFSHPVTLRFNVTSLTEESHIVVHGVVESLQYVWRDNLAPRRTTDVTIRIQDIPKGEPNLGDDRVIFMIPGGRGLEVPHTPKFDVGEKVLLFLFYTPRGPEAWRKIHGGLVVINKREVANDTEVSIPYTTYKDRVDGGSPEVIDFDKPIHLPIDLVVKLAEAASKEPLLVLRAEEPIIEFAKHAEWIESSRFTKPGKDLLDSVKADIDEILKLSARKEENDNKK